jgi:hypothetical protein
MTFPTAKIELHQWANSILLLVVGFFASQTYYTIKEDHERIANHETRISVLESNGKRTAYKMLPKLEAILCDEITVKKILGE